MAGKQAEKVECLQLKDQKTSNSSIELCLFQFFDQMPLNLAN